MQVTVKQVMLVVALFGINIAAAIYARENRKGPLNVSVGSGRGMRLANPDGSIVFIPGHLEGGPPLAERPHHLVRPPIPRPLRAVSGLRRWAPLMVSGAITLLAALAMVRRSLPRGLMLMMLLFGINFA